MTRWVRFDRDGTVQTGRLEDNAITPVGAADPLTALLSGAAESGPSVALESVRLLAPVSPIRNVFCVGWNYLPHFEEGSRVHGDRPLPDRPNFFTKATRTVIGPFDPIPAHRDVTARLDWEVELGAIVGREASNLSEADALSVVAGYVVAQDLTARDVQHAHGGQWFRGKSLDGTCPIGPWLVGAEEVIDPQRLDISCMVNGTVKQASNTAHMIFPIARLLAELSQGLTLLPGDILLTGTPEGVGQSRQPPEFLNPGDVVESTVEGIGTIRNTVVDTRNV